MPNYIDLFGIQLESKKERFIEYLSKGIDLKQLEKEYEEQFNKYFYPLNFKSNELNFDAIAIDSSGKKREFKNGIYFYITRASGIQNNGNIIRLLDTDVFTLNGPNSEVDRYFGRKAEYIELKLLKNFLDNQKENNNLQICLIDGSIYSRLMSQIFEFTVVNDETFMVEYFKLFFEILKSAKEKNIILIGVSKDSRDNFFRNELLDQIYFKERDELKKSGALNSGEISIIEAAIESTDDYDETKIRRFKALINQKFTLLQKLSQIYNEYNFERTDGEILFRFAKSQGYTAPMEKGLGRSEQRKVFYEISKNTRSYIISRFKKYISKLTEIEKEDFIINTEKILQDFKEIPTFISFHILPDVRDSPIKIDIPSWYFTEYNLLNEYPFITFFKSLDTSSLIEKIIRILMKLNGGLDNYNLLLTAAHEEAVVKEKAYNEIYEQFLKDKLNLLLPYKRRTRRELNK